MAVGEAGGYNEHISHRPFVGKAGSVFTAYCRASGLARPDIFVTNLYPFWTGSGNPDPTPAQIAGSEHILRADIARVKPRVIATLGRIPTRWFLGDVDMEMVHGTPCVSARAPRTVIVPCYHPAAGFYNPELASFAQDDLLRFAYLLRNPVKARRRPKYKVVWKRTPRPEYVGGFVDTEGLVPRPWGFSWSKDGRVAEVVLYRPGWKPPRLRGRIVFHNALHDLPVLRAMGIDTSEIDVDDTMVMAFNLRLEPQALKALAFRHCGMKMASFEDIVRPWFNREAVAWLRKAAEFEYDKPEPIAVADLAKRKWREYKPQGLGRRIGNLLKSYETKPDETKLEKRWAEIGETQWIDFTREFQAKATANVGREFPDFAIFSVPRKKAVAYSGLDAVATALIEPSLKRMVEEKGLSRVYEMDRKALRFVDRMQEVGLRIDLEKLRALEAELSELREERAADVRRIVGDRWFNPGSSDQVSGWLYKAKGLPVLRYTDTGRGSTSDESLMMLRGYHSKGDPDVRAFIEAEQDYREADKYHGTFVLPVLRYMRQDASGDWRLHPNFRVTRVISGRNSSHEPNVLAFPTRTELGKRIRSCFVARDGHLILSCDASQIELRVMAHHSRDPKMVRAFEAGADLHALTTTLIFRIALEEVAKYPAKRYVAKTINFAVMYGISPQALLEQLYKAGIFDFTLRDCERFIAEWFAAYPSVRRYLKKLWEQAEKDGFVRDMWGRMCYVPNLRVLDGPMREAAQRLAGNMPIQGGAHGLVKRAEIRCGEWIEEEGLRDAVQPWLQIHDELLLEVKEERMAEVAEVVEHMMRADQRMVSVPITANSKAGRSWGKMAGWSA
jgi:uracil-DNA glycosylase family 4